MNLIINTEEIKKRIVLNKKSRRFEFRVLPKSKTRLDLDYYPLLPPRGIQDLTDSIQEAIVNWVIKTLNTINTDTKVHSVTNIIFLDTFTDIEKKHYNVWSKSGRFLGTYSTSALPDMVEQVLLKMEPRAHQYQEVIMEFKVKGC